VQLSGSIPSAALTQSLAQIRAKLAEAYHQDSEELRERKQELCDIRDELAAEHEKLTQQKHQFDAWAKQRRNEIEQMAERLVAREQQLQQQETEMAQRTRGWELERAEYQHELRRLKARLPEPDESLTLA
jgi:chromosome segregation ATPase